MDIRNLSGVAFLRQMSRHEEVPTVIRRGAGFLTIAVLVFLAIAVGASPPDPGWIEGLSDAADGDDVVSQLSETVGSAEGGTDKSLSPPSTLPHSPPLQQSASNPLLLQVERGPPVSPAA